MKNLKEVVAGAKKRLDEYYPQSDEERKAQSEFSMSVNKVLHSKFREKAQESTSKLYEELYKGVIDGLKAEGVEVLGKLREADISDKVKNLMYETACIKAKADGKAEW